LMCSLRIDFWLLRLLCSLVHYVFFFRVVHGKAFLFQCSLCQIIKIGKPLAPLLFKLRQYMDTTRENLASVLAYAIHLMLFGFPSGIIR
jgi:hypothetical protein